MGGRFEGKADAIDAITQVRTGVIALTFEYMPEVTVALGTSNFDSVHSMALVGYLDNSVPFEGREK